MSNSSKSPIASTARSTTFGWVLVLLAVGAAALVPLYKDDIARSWPLADWPGSDWEINKHAALFWSCALIWLLLFISRKTFKNNYDGAINAEFWRRSAWLTLRILLAAVAWVFVSKLLVMYFILPWKSVVSNNLSLALWIGIPAVAISLCSASEVIFLNWKKPTQGDPGKFANATLSRRFISWIVRGVMTNSNLTNAIIVMANTALAITLTVKTGHYLQKGDSGDSASELFMIYGITIILFLIGEMIPKQLAINLAERESKPAKGLANIWLGVLCLTLLLPLLCYGIVDTLEGFPQESKPSADA